MKEKETKDMLQTMWGTQHRRQGQNIMIRYHHFEVVREFIYLGSAIDYDNDTGPEIVRRITPAIEDLLVLSGAHESRLTGGRSMLAEALVYPGLKRHITK